ncbi:MAG: VCBS repeat-containing protein, partial [Acidobacteria bacterium]|nr:VCBS repeat-containing protein [Acidobacteriota bacterium]
MKKTRLLLLVFLLACSNIIYLSSQANSKNFNLSNKTNLLLSGVLAGSKNSKQDKNIALATTLKGTTFNTRSFDLPQALNPLSINSGDFDKDGDIDLVTVNSDSNSLSILKNDGKGNFFAKDIILSEVGGLRALTVGDLDGDGDLDLVTANTLSSNITILTNNGTGNFIVETPYLSKITNPTSILSADLDKDGDLDIITASQINNTIAIINNDGTAKFIDSNIKLLQAYDPSSLAVADLDKDQNLDIITISQNSQSLTILTNNGNFEFNDKITSLEKAPTSLLIGDINKDGNLDIITSNQDSTITILLNQDNRFVESTFDLPENAAAPLSMAIGDLDRDGDLDLITANQESNNLTVLANNDGKFATASAVNVDLAKNSKPFSLITADIDSDGYLDLATANSKSNSVNLLLNIHPNNTTTQTLPFTQNWSNTGLITTDDNWNNVPGIVGYRGDDITNATAVDPQTLLGEGTITIDVIANQNNPNALATGGVAEFDGITNPSVALNGSGTADAPNIIINLNTTGFTNVNVAYNLRDLDGSADNAVQPVALQYRVGTTGNFTNVPAGFVADATSGPNLATQVTAVSATLPSAANNQSTVQVRVITANANGNDEWVGIDDINITGTAMAAGSLQFSSATYSVAENGTSATITVTRTGGSSGTVTVNYATSNGTAIAGSDYTASNGTLTFGDGVTSQTFSVPVIDDLIDENDETVNLSL